MSQAPLGHLKKQKTIKKTLDKPGENFLKKTLDKILNRSYNKYRKNEREVNKMAIKTIRTEGFFEPADYEIIWETVCMTCTFAVGIQTDKRNEFSIFYVTNMDGKDIYHILDTGFLDVYYKNNFSVEEKVKEVEEKVKEEMKKVITEVLTARIKADIINTQRKKERK